MLYGATLYIVICVYIHAVERTRKQLRSTSVGLLWSYYIHTSKGYIHVHVCSSLTYMPAEQRV